MPFQTKCPGCGRSLEVPDAVVGKRVKCPACAQVWQVPAPAASRPAAEPTPAPAAAQPAAIKAKCPGCGQTLQVPAGMVGKRAKCPACAHVWTIGRMVVDAEAVPDMPPPQSPRSTPAAPAAPKQSEWFDDMMSDDYPIAAVQNFSKGTAGTPAPAAEPPRRPCPECGEMVPIGAVKCRFCDAIFDEKLRRAETKKKRRRGGWSGGSDDDLSGGDWVVCVLCPGIGCIGGIIYLILGRQKGWKVLGVSFLASMFWGIIRIAIIASQTPGGLR